MNMNHDMMARIRAPLVDAANLIADKQLRSDVTDIIWFAHDNAVDTIYTELAAPESDYEPLFMASIQGMLAMGDRPEAVVVWFASQGVQA